LLQIGAYATLNRYRRAYIFSQLPYAHTTFPKRMFSVKHIPIILYIIRSCGSHVRRDTVTANPKPLIEPWTRIILALDWAKSRPNFSFNYSKGVVFDALELCAPATPLLTAQNVNTSSYSETPQWRSGSVTPQWLSGSVTPQWLSGSSMAQWLSDSSVAQ
jgi:hypothetical protein